MADPRDALRPTDIAPLLEQVGAFVDTRLPRWNAPGVVVGITGRERTLGAVARGWADLSARRPVTTADRFQIGSISKSFAAIIALQEHEKGRLDLRAPVTEYVPWFSVRSGFAPITLHHLLTHTSGLATGSEMSPDARHELWALRDFECTYAPGERFLYSNDGYKLLGIALEELTGTPFPQLLAERLLKPLGMDDSEPMITLATRATTATPHQRMFDDRPGHQGHPLVASPWYETASADGSIVSTAADMCAYARLLLNRGEGPEGRLLGDDGFRLLTSRYVEDLSEEDWYGYGLGIYEAGGRRLIGHSGGMVGFSSYLMIDPEAGLGVVVLMNGNEDRRDLVDYVLEAGRAEAAGRALPEPPPPADPTHLGDAAEEYAGVYTAPGDGPEAGEGPTGRRSLTLAAAEGRLVLQLEGADVVLERDDGDVFLVPHPDLDRFALRFWRDDEGRVTHVTHGADWFAGPAYGGPAGFASVPDAAALCGHYHCWNPWMNHLRIVERRGSLWLIAPWVEEAAGEIELVPLGGGSFRVGREEWRPDRLTVDTVLDGIATRAVYDFLPFYRAATP
jgi:CubicO group peptidase (beta-lactamase class C family)